MLQDLRAGLTLARICRKGWLKRDMRIQCVMRGGHLRTFWRGALLCHLLARMTNSRSPREVERHTSSESALNVGTFSPATTAIVIVGSLRLGGRLDYTISQGAPTLAFAGKASGGSVTYMLAVKTVETWNNSNLTPARLNTYERNRS